MRQVVQAAAQAGVKPVVRTPAPVAAQDVPAPARGVAREAVKPAAPAAAQVVLRAVQAAAQAGVKPVVRTPAQALAPVAQTPAPAAARVVARVVPVHVQEPAPGVAPAARTAPGAAQAAAPAAPAAQTAPGVVPGAALGIVRMIVCIPVPVVVLRGVRIAAQVIAMGHASIETDQAPLSVITLEHGYKCNLNCTYCANKHKIVENTLRSFDINRILDRFMDDQKDNFADHISLCSCCGEALLYIDSILVSSYIAEKYFPRCRITNALSTNGQLFSKEDIRRKADKLANSMFQISFDNDQKHPKNLSKQAIDFITDHRFTLDYVIAAKEEIPYLKDNVTAIYGMFRKYPRILYNYYASEELPLIWESIRDALKAAGYKPKEAQPRETFSVLQPDTCGYVFINADGSICGCADKDIHNGWTLAMAREKLKELDCGRCKYRFQCNPCLKGIAKSKGNLCYMVRALYDH